ncbi:hypothetical protein C4D60_Mb09t24140 [Musa balbisiana]|uniref:Uncharacterized protein n=1 Tax=Musa balbisiana TaxID=52838 RepID=A0A4S8IIS9_MUSBA|nr:hypothetical protein C4D60_Mb09t24140 [Musa balbisiana]
MAWKHHTKQIMKPSISHGMTSFSIMINLMSGVWVDCKVEIVGHSGDEHQLTSPAATQHAFRSFNLKLDCPHSPTTSLEFVHLLHPGHTAVPLERE